MSEAPIGVVAADAGGLSVVRALARAMPYEDFVLLADDAYAPYAARRAELVRRRVCGAAGELAAAGAKALVLASAMSSIDGLEAVRERHPSLPVVGFGDAVADALARAGEGTVAAITGEGCVRGLAQARALRRARGGELVAAPWPGLRELVARGAADGPDGRALAAARLADLDAHGVRVVALACAHAACLRAVVDGLVPEGVTVTDGATLAARRLHGLLVRGGLLVRRRRRRGRQLVLSSDPVRGGRGLARGAARGR